MKNIKDVDDQPLYDINSLSYKENQMVGLKNNLAMRQGWRCINCQNPLIPSIFNKWYSKVNMSNKLGIILAEISAGELIDKITILII